MKTKKPASRKAMARKPRAIVLKSHPTAIARSPHPSSLYPDEWTVVIPPRGYGFNEVIGRGATPRQAWAYAASKLNTKIYAFPGRPRNGYAERKPTFPCVVFALAINNGAGTHCPNQKALDRINDYTFPSSWTPAISLTTPASKR